MMEVNNLEQKYSKSHQYIHWLTALLILCVYPLGKYMEGLELAEKVNLIKIHIVLGNVVLLLTFIRCYFFFTRERPTNIQTGSKINDVFAKIIHSLLYILLLAIGLTGLVRVFFNCYKEVLLNSDISAVLPLGEAIPTAHGFMSFVFVLLLALHVIGVIKHIVLRKENILKRMS